MKLLYFAWLREKAGVSEEDAEVPGEVSTVEQLLDWMVARGGGYADAFADRSIIRVAVNQEYVSLEHAVSAGDEVAFFPPVTGG